MNMFYDVVSDAFYIYFGAVYEQPKKWLLGQEIAQIREVWQMKPAGSNSMVWTKLRTVFPGGYPLLTTVMWDDFGRFGLSMTGINATSSTAGAGAYYNREVRLYLLGEGGN